MKLATFSRGNAPSFGVVLADGGIVDLPRRLPGILSTLLSVLTGDALPLVREVVDANASADFHQDEVEFLPLFDSPVTIHCVGLNYAAHTAEAGMKQPDFPRTFIKIPSALVGHGTALNKPTLSPEFDFEGELAVVIGRRAYGVSAEDAADYIAGYTCFMDGSVRDWQLQRTLDQGKNFRRSSSMGPYLVTPDEVGPLGGLTLKTYVNDEVMQQSLLSKMIFPVEKLIEYVSRFTELRPGDVIATGTPEGVGFKRNPPRYLQHHDTVKVEIEKVGTLLNQVSGE
ncbi:fumarylacetoacetate hydrolase family protein [Paraburkholderia agricolaris]|uniref:Fumarylacetoacetate hydrolase family protein n=1 Tax=Paraburkholderia agricolaris TaxID=2152888 RepID=A0ABW9A1Q9_9BURK